MRIPAESFLAFIFAALLFFPNAAKAEVRTIDVSEVALNSSPLYGPEGIVRAQDGSLFVGEQDGRVRRITLDGNVEEFADLGMRQS